MLRQSKQPARQHPAREPDVVGGGDAGDGAREVVLEAREQRRRVAAEREPVDADRGAVLGAEPLEQAADVPDGLRLEVDRVQVVAGEEAVARADAHLAGSVQRQDRERHVQTELVVEPGRRKPGEVGEWKPHAVPVDADEPGARRARMAEQPGVARVIAAVAEPALASRLALVRRVFARERQVLVAEPARRRRSELRRREHRRLGMIAHRRVEEAARVEELERRAELGRDAASIADGNEPQREGLGHEEHLVQRHLHGEPERQPRARHVGDVGHIDQAGPAGRQDAGRQHGTQDQVDHRDDMRRPASERTSVVVAIAWSSSNDVSTSLAKWCRSGTRSQSALKPQESASS